MAIGLTLIQITVLLVQVTAPSSVFDSGCGGKSPGIDRGQIEGQDVLATGPAK